MGRPSKNTTSRLKNLKGTSGHQKATVEDITDSEDEIYVPSAQNGPSDLMEEGFFFLDEESCSDEDSDFGDEEMDDDELKELETEEQIYRFNAILAEAQAVAIQAAKEAAESKPKRKRHYTGNSARTVRHYALKRRQLEASGQKLISSMFLKCKDSGPPVHVAPQPEVLEVPDEDSDSEDEFDEPEIQERVHQLFSCPVEVRMFTMQARNQSRTYHLLRKECPSELGMPEYLAG